MFDNRSLISCNPSRRLLNSAALTGLIVLLSFAVSGPLAAQPTTSARDFLLTFIPNFHTGSDTDSLYIMIHAESPTSGRIDYRNRQWEEFSQAFEISDPNFPFVLALPYQNFELRGFNNGSIFSRPDDTTTHQVEYPAPQSFRVLVDDGQPPVQVLALNRGNKTSDAFTILPVAGLDQVYVVLAYKSDGTSRNGTSLNSSSTPSQIAIVATENNTQVNVSLSVARTYISRSSRLNVTLQRGEVFLVQANMGIPDNLDDDLSGSRIVANKPVAVFAGHQRAQVPKIAERDRPTRSMMAQQLPPVSTWGKRYIIAPFPNAGNEGGSGTDVFRVLAGSDGTTVSLDDAFLVLLDAGQWYEGPLDDAHLLSANRPILVAQYRKSASDTQSGADALPGDPCMLIPPPVEQYLPALRWNNPDVRDAADNIVFAPDNQHVTILAAASDVAKLQFDAAQAASIFTFNPIGETSFVWATGKVTPGLHSVSGAEAAVFVTGYGNQDAYSYSAGQQLDRLEESSDDAITSVISALDGEGMPGNNGTLDFELTFLEVPASIGAGSLDSYEIQLRFRAECLEPVEPSERGNIVDQHRIVSLRRKYEGQTNGQILLQLPVVIAADASGCIPVQVLDFRWFDKDNAELPVNFSPQHGEFCKRSDSVETSIRFRDQNGAPGAALPLTVDLNDLFVPASLPNDILDSFAIVLRFNADILEPVVPAERGNVNANLRTIELRRKYNGQQAGDALLQINALVLPGGAKCSSLDITAFSWLDADGREVRSKKQFASGEFCKTRDSVHVHWQIDDVEAAPGEDLVAQIRAERIFLSEGLQQNFNGTFELEFAFNATVLTASDPDQRGFIRDGLRVLPLQGELLAVTTPQRVATITLEAALGDSEFSDMLISSFSLSDVDTAAVAVSWSQDTGRFHLGDVWRDDVQGTRLVNSQSAALNLTISPNPFTQQTAIQVSGPQLGEGGTLLIFDVFGNLVKDLSADLIALAGDGSLTFVPTDLAAGIYYCRLTAGEAMIVRPLILR